MQRLTITTTLVLALFLGACGTGASNSKVNNVTGNWTATLTGNANSPSFALSLSMFQNSDGSISVTNLDFTTASPCFPAGTTTASGAFTLSGTINGVTGGGVTNGNLALIIKSSPSTNNALTLRGTVSNNTVTGTWTLTGTTSGCTGSGNFTMQLVAP